MTRSNTWPPLSALALAWSMLGCAVAPADASPGQETGPCQEGDCFDGLTCLSNLCVDEDPEDGSEGSAEDDDAGKPGGEDGGNDDGSPSDDGGNDGGGNDDGGTPGDDDGGNDDGGTPGDDGGNDDGGTPGDDGGNDDSNDDGNDDGGGGVGECCEPTGSPGCSDSVIEDCVCAADSFCCSNTWDATCVNQSVICGQDCPTPEPGSCCAASTAAGCTEPEVEECVCASEMFATCCNDAWNILCVFAAQSCGAVCS